MPIIQFLTKPCMLLFKQSNHATLKHPLKNPKMFTLNDEYVKTDNGEPPDNTNGPPSIGNYCFRVTTTLNKETDKMREYVGYDDNISIVEKVERFCANDKQLYCDTKCSRSKLSFVHDVPNCDGHVDIKDFNHGAIYQSF